MSAVSQLDDDAGAPFVLVIEDPKRGDFANVLALGQLISERLDCTVTVKQLKLRGSILLPLLRLVIDLISRTKTSGSVRKLAQRMFFRGDYLGDAKPIAVVSTLGRGEAQGAFVSAFWDVPAIHLGTPKRLSSKYFTAIVTHAGDQAKGSEIPLSVSPTRVRLRRGRGGRYDFEISKICLLLGGDARGVAHYEARFWSRCVEAAMKTAAKCGARLTVSTSPRSGAIVEALVEEEIRKAPQLAIDLIKYGCGDRRDIAWEIVSADVVLVTAESISMMSDAIASGARVVALYDAELPRSDRIQSFIKYHTTAGTLHLLDLSVWKDGRLELNAITPLKNCWSEALWPSLGQIFENRRSIR